MYMLYQYIKIYEVRVCLLASKHGRPYFKECAKTDRFSGEDAVSAVNFIRDEINVT